MPPASTLRLDRCPCGQRRPVGVLLGMRSGARPRLEGRWYCRPTCLETALLERARRDFPEQSPGVSRMRHRIPLGLLLQARGVITGDLLKRALERQSATGRRLGQVLAEDFQISDERITRAIAAQWGLPVLHLPERVSLNLLHLAPARFFSATGCVPVDIRQGRLLLASAEGGDPAIALALERMHGLEVDFGVVSSAVLDRWRLFEEAPQVPLQMERCDNRTHMALHAAELLQRLQPVESRVVRMGRWWWLRVWLEQAALDRGGVSDDVLDIIYAMPDGSGSDAAGHTPLALS